MSISLALAVAVMLAGLIYLCVTKAWGTIFAHMFLAGLIACLLAFGGSASLRIG